MFFFCVLIACHSMRERACACVGVGKRARGGGYTSFSQTSTQARPLSNQRYIFKNLSIPITLLSTPYHAELY